MYEADDERRYAVSAAAMEASAAREKSANFMMFDDDSDRWLMLMKFFDIDIFVLWTREQERIL